MNNTQKNVLIHASALVAGLVLNNVIDNKLAQSENPGRVNRWYRKQLKKGRSPWNVGLSVLMSAAFIAIEHEARKPIIWNVTCDTCGKPFPIPAESYEFGCWECDDCSRDYLMKVGTPVVLDETDENYNPCRHGDPENGSAIDAEGLCNLCGEVLTEIKFLRVRC